MSVKLCKDCKYFVPNEEWADEVLKARYSTCGKTSLVDGKDGEQCSIMRRGFFSTCGRSGRWWEPKP